MRPERFDCSQAASVWIRRARRDFGASNYRQRQFQEAHDRYASSPAQLEASDVSAPDRTFDLALQAPQTTYEITTSGVNGTTVHIRQDGKVWTTAE